MRRAGEGKGGDVSKPKRSSSFYAGAAEAAKREADEAAKFNFQCRAAQLAMAARDIAALESINAELVEALEEMDAALTQLEAIYISDFDPGAVDAARPMWLNVAHEKVRAALAKARGGEE